MSSDESDLELATLWFLAARAMSAADGTLGTSRQAAAGLYAQAILGLSEEACQQAKSDENIATLTLLDCLGKLAFVSREVGEKIMTGVMMISYSNFKMHPMEVRWASMLASALSLEGDDFQRCCVNARVMAGMLDTHGAQDVVDAESVDPEGGTK
jgi:hypothetical protein